MRVFILAGADVAPVSVRANFTRESKGVSAIVRLLSASIII